MSTLRQLRNFWIPWVSTIVLVCFSDAVAQVSYKLTDLGTNKPTDNFSMAMGLNNQGWTLNMDGFVTPPQNFMGTSVVNGRAVINRGGVNIDLGTLGKPDANSWINWGGINDAGVATGMSETAVPDPNGEDFCGFGTFLTCVAFVWKDGHMSPLPPAGGNNAQGSAINNRGQIAGQSEGANVDPTCPQPAPTLLPVLWENLQVHVLPLLGTDVDGYAQGINDQGTAVGYSGICADAVHAVMWKNNTVIRLQDTGHTRSNYAFAINSLGQIVGKVRSLDGTTFVPALWQPDGTLKTLPILQGDVAAFATGINNLGQVVGNTIDSGNDWSHGFIWQNNVMTDLNTLIPADSNLFIINASNINERGQISGMAKVVSGPHTGEIHSFLATPVDASLGTSMAEFARTHPSSNSSAHHYQLSRAFGLGGFEQ